LGELSEIGMHKMYHEMARRKREVGSFLEAKNYYLEAIKYNPVDLDILFDLATCYRELEDYENLKEMAFELYSYCFTKIDIAWFYRLLGNYYLEKMKPQIAKDLYDYSNLFFETEAANNEIIYLQKAMEQKLKDNTVKEIQQELLQENIPTQISSKTLAFVYKIAKQAIEIGNIPYGKQLLFFLYEVTGDEEVKHDLDILSN
jgi:tetratricopeptide (TPR) repeat protein